MKKIRLKITKGKCSNNQLKCGCMNIAPVQSRRLTLWAKADKKICATRDTSLTFATISQYVGLDNRCLDGFKKCPQSSKRPQEIDLRNNLEDHSICIPEASRCPINSIHILPSSQSQKRLLGE